MNYIPKTMKAVQLIAHGGLDNLAFKDDVPVPTPGPKDVLVKVGAAGVNNTDLNTRLGWYSKSEGNRDDASWAGKAIEFPRIQGADVCGTVVQCGKEVDSELLHKRVLIEPCIRIANGSELELPWYFGSECDGGFAEYAVVAARHAYPVQSGQSDVDLASFPCSYSTAENLLTRARVSKNERVLVTGSSGGVGSATVQLAKARGAEVIAVTTSSKAEQILKLGADRTVARDSDVVKEIGSSQVDVVIDLVAGEKWSALLDVLKPFGRYAVAGAIAGPLVDLDVRTLYLKDLTFYGCTVLDLEVFGNLVHRIESGNITPVVAKTYPLERVADAQRDFQLKQHVGKLVIDLSLSGT